jgi:hypothetical protein
LLCTVVHDFVVRRFNVSDQNKDNQERFETLKRWRPGTAPLTLLRSTNQNRVTDQVRMAQRLGNADAVLLLQGDNTQNTTNNSIIFAFRNSLRLRQNTTTGLLPSKLPARRSCCRSVIYNLGVIRCAGFFKLSFFVVSVCFCLVFVADRRSSGSRAHTA